MAIPTLTIAIPTFNRNAILFQNLKHLLPQIDKNVNILIIDNCSDIKVEGYLKKKIKIYQNKIRVIRNPVNIGGDANILRCIELCESDYIWILGDDDFPFPDALKKIQKFLEYGDPIWVNFYSFNKFLPNRNSEIKTSTLISFLKHFDSINELVFISNNIYKTSCIKEGLVGGFLNLHMRVPHLISMLYGVIKSKPIGKYYITKDQLFLSISNNKDRSTSWPLSSMFVNTIAIFQLPIFKNISNELLQLLRGARKNWLSNKYMIAAFWELSSNQGIFKSLQISSNVIINLLIIDGFKFLLSLPLYFFSIFTGFYFWPRKELIKKLYKKLLSHFNK